MAAHPQRNETAAPDGEESAAPAVKNPFPSEMTVLDVNGKPVVLDLAVAGDVLYAPGLDDAPVSPDVRQFVTQYCSTWSALLTWQNPDYWCPDPPRRAQLFFRETQLRAMLGLQGDEQLLRASWDDVAGSLRFVIESPRLPRQPFWDGGPPVITLPVAAYYEGAQ